MKKIEIRSYDSDLIEQLREVFFSSVRQNAKGYYTDRQLQAWAPAEYDREAWRSRIDAIRPFIALIDGTAVGYADVQPTGYIDHFFVRGGVSGKGIGRALMMTIVEHAQQNAISLLYSDVSLAAEGFFEKFGFSVLERRSVERNGMVIANARMTKSMQRLS